MNYTRNERLTNKRLKSFVKGTVDYFLSKKKSISFEIIEQFTLCFVLILIIKIFIQLFYIQKKIFNT